MYDINSERKPHKDPKPILGKYCPVCGYYYPTKEVYLEHAKICSEEKVEQLKDDIGKWYKVVTSIAGVHTTTIGQITGVEGTSTYKVRKMTYTNKDSSITVECLRDSKQHAFTLGLQFIPKSDAMNMASAVFTPMALELFSEDSE